MLPARFPNLLVNGSEGIAVGMATKIPPHNLREVAAGVQWYLENFEHFESPRSASPAQASTGKRGRKPRTGSRSAPRTRNCSTG